MRVNMVVALADLASRFPNLLEPWTAEIYLTLAGKQLMSQLMGYLLYFVGDLRATHNKHSSCEAVT